MEEFQKDPNIDNDSRSFDPEMVAAYRAWLYPIIKRMYLVYATCLFILPLIVAIRQFPRQGAEIIYSGRILVFAGFWLSGAIMAYTMLYIRSQTYVPRLTITAVILALVSALAGSLLGIGDAKLIALEAAKIIVLTLAVTSMYYPKLSILLILLASTIIAYISINILQQPAAVTLMSVTGLPLFCIPLIILWNNNMREFHLLKVALQTESKKSENLLKNIFPGPVFKLVRNQEKPKFVQRFEDATVLFADLVGFTKFANQHSADEVVAILDQIMSRLDASCEQIGAVKVKTIGDAYLAVGGLPDPDPEHIFKMADLAIEFREAIKKYSALTGHDFKMRIGLHSGAVVAGIIGHKTMHFDIWGDTVNFASRLESHGVVGEIQISEDLAERLRDRFEVRERGVIDIKGRGTARTYLLVQPKIDNGSSSGHAA